MENLRIRVGEGTPDGERDMGLCAYLEWLVRANFHFERGEHIIVHCTLE
jgi:hypothetical protein